MNRHDYYTPASFLIHRQRAGKGRAGSPWSSLLAEAPGSRSPPDQREALVPSSRRPVHRAWGGSEAWLLSSEAALGPEGSPVGVEVAAALGSRTRGRVAGDYNSQVAPRRRRWRRVRPAPPAAPGNGAGGGRGWGRPGARCGGWGPPSHRAREEVEGRATPTRGGRPRGPATPTRPGGRGPGMRSQGPPVELRGVRGARRGGCLLPSPSALAGGPRAARPS